MELKIYQVSYRIYSIPSDRINWRQAADIITVCSELRSVGVGVAFFGGLQIMNVESSEIHESSFGLS